MHRTSILSRFLTATLFSLAACSSSSGEGGTPDQAGAGDGGVLDASSTGDASSAGDGSSASSDDSGPDPIPSGLTVTTITPDTAIKPAYIGVLKNGNLVLTEGREHKVDEMEVGGEVTHVNSTDFVDFEWPRSIAVDDAGRLFIAGYQQIHAYAETPSDPHQTFVAASGNKQTYDWIYYGGSPRKLWALTGPNPTSPKMQFVRFDAATDGSAGAPTVVYELDRFSVMSFVVDAQNTVFTVDSNSCRIRKITSDGAVTILAGKPEAEQGVCNIGSAYERDSTGNVILPQAGALAWDPSSTKLLLVGASSIADVTEQADGKSKAEVLYKFEDGVTPDAAATSADALYVVDSTSGTVRKVVF